MWSNRNIIVVGKVVSGRVGCAVNVLFDSGKQYPNKIFSVFIKIEDLVNFGYEPVSFLKGKSIAVIGKAGDLGGKPVMYIGNGKDMDVIRWRSSIAEVGELTNCPPRTEAKFINKN